MNVEQMRTEVSKAYPGERWPVMVKKMKDTQIQAIYLKFKKEGRIK